MCMCRTKGVYSKGDVYKGSWGECTYDTTAVSLVDTVHVPTNSVMDVKSLLQWLKWPLGAVYNRVWQSCWLLGYDDDVRWAQLCQVFSASSKL